MIHDTDPRRGLSQLAAAHTVCAARARSDTADPDNGRLTGLITAAPTLKVAAGEFQRAADLYNQIEAQPDAAFARLQAATRLVGAGRRAEANAQLRRAVAFCYRVSPTGYLRESQTLVAATAQDCSHSLTFVSSKAMAVVLDLREELFQSA